MKSPYLRASSILFAASIAWAGCGEGEAEPLVDQSTNGLVQRLDKLEFANPSGSSRTFTTNGKVNLKKFADHPFFASLGTNGRACIHCHQIDQGFGISAAGVQQRFDASAGTDPIFRTNDGSNSPNADVSTLAAKRSAYSMLRTKALIRVEIGVPASAEFTLSAVNDPYGYVTIGGVADGTKGLSLFRRPLPSTNLKAITGVMWDGRESPPGLSVIEALLNQSNDATLGHAQALLGLTTDQRAQIVDFETNLFTAQVCDNAAGDLTVNGGLGGPEVLAAQPFYVGINDVLTGDSQTHAPFDPRVFKLYDNWVNSFKKNKDGRDAARAAVARGQAIFNTHPITITGVGGLNNLPGLSTVNGTCTTCHDTPSFGNHSVTLPINIGIADGTRRTPDMPLYTLKNKTTGETVATTDPGRALITGRWADVGKFKGPILRALASRAPYFHNGSAASLDDVVGFYESRFAVGLTSQERADLVAFLRTL